MMSASTRTNTKAKTKIMLSLLSIVLTFLALTLLPGLFISRRLKVPFSFSNILRFIKITASKYDDVEKMSSTIEQEIRGKPIPKHVAVILDGNRRWAKKRGQGPSEGQEAGSRKLMETAIRLMENAKDCFTMGTNTVSLFAFSTENWGRPEDEVIYLMDLFERYIKSMEPYFRREKIKVSVIGKRTNIPEALLDTIQKVEEATKSYEGKLLIIALDYSGKFDILQACKSLAEKVKNGLIQVEDIDEKAMDKELMTNCSDFPSPDLLIRTSGEQRISNFYLWQAAYSELYFPDVQWPDFDEVEILKALTWYQSRQRRFGLRV